MNTFFTYSYCLILLYYLDTHGAFKITYDTEGIRFVILGDWGGLPSTPFSTPIERAIAKELGLFVKNFDIRFFLALGDNFYYDGVSSVDDPRFKETYENIFNEASLYLDWYLVAGNHDHNGNVSAQLIYSTLEKRWKFPNYFYTIHIADESSSVTIDIVMIDTVILCGNSDLGVLGLQPLGPEDEAFANLHWDWIRDQLAASKSNYLIVAGHYPVFSIGQHGPTKCLVDKLLPMLHKYSASAYLSGHDHNLQHLEYMQNNQTVQYFVSGAANFVNAETWNRKNVPHGSSKFFWGDIHSLGGFAFANITSQGFNITFVDSKALLLYSKLILPRHL